MSWNSDRLLTAVLVICAVITTGLVVHREFFAPAARSVSPARQKPVFIAGWRFHLDRGVRLGSSSAPIQLLEFADFECPFCASFHATLKKLRERYPTQVAISFVHYPLPMHRFAEPAARAAECAGEQGRFQAMHDNLFEQQDQLGLKPWREFATEAGVADLATFETCIQNKDAMPRVIGGRRLAEELDIQGTPTIVLNGWKLPLPPSAAELDRMVKAVLAGKSPVASAEK